MYNCENNQATTQNISWKRQKDKIRSTQNQHSRRYHQKIRLDSRESNNFECKLQKENNNFRGT